MILLLQWHSVFTPQFLRLVHPEFCSHTFNSPCIPLLFRLWKSHYFTFLWKVQMWNRIWFTLSILKHHFFKWTSSKYVAILLIWPQYKSCTRWDRKEKVVHHQQSWFIKICVTRWHIYDFHFTSPSSAIQQFHHHPRSIGQCGNFSHLIKFFLQCGCHTGACTEWITSPETNRNLLKAVEPQE